MKNVYNLDEFKSFFPLNNVLLKMYLTKVITLKVIIYFYLLFFSNFS